MRELIKGLKVLFLTLFAYLFQACAMQYFAIDSVTPSLIFCTLAIFTVSLGKKYTFCASCIIGILMESMLSNVPAMYAIAFPVIGMLGAQAFADRSERQREKRLEQQMNLQKKGRGLMQHLSRGRMVEMPALLRIPLCAMMMDLIWHTVMCVYMYLIGTDISLVNFTRLFSGVMYTGFITLVLMLPARWFLGMYKKKKQPREKEEDFHFTGRQSRFADEDTNDDEENPIQPEENTPSPDDTDDLYDPDDITPEEGEW